MASTNILTTVCPLKNQCMRTVRNLIGYHLNDDDNIVNVYKTIDEYLYDKTTPIDVVENLLNYILQEAPQLDAGIRFSALQLILRPQIRHLTIGIFPSAYHETIMEVILRQGLNLCVLDLSGIWIRDDQPFVAGILAKMGRKFTNLKHLTLPYITMNTSLMEAVGSFKSLRSLQSPGDYSNVAKDDVFVNTFSQLKQLRVLNIGYGQYEEQELQLSLAKVLIELEHLESFGEYAFVGNVLKFYQKLVPEQKTRLKNVIDSLTTELKYQTIIETCPQLQSLQLNEPEDQNILETLSQDFQQLKKLHLQKIECSRLELNPITLSSLCWQSITIANGTGALNINKIFSMAANLHTLKCDKVEIAFRPLTLPMRSLEKIELVYCEFQSTQQLRHCVRFLLRTIRKLFIENCSQLCDTDFIGVHDDVRNDIQLEDLLLQNAQDLTVKTAQHFIKTVPKLRRLGSLDKWNINETDLEHLRNFAQNCGKQIEFVTSN